MSGTIPTPELTKSMSATETMKTSSGSVIPGLESVVGGCFSIQRSNAEEAVGARLLSPLVMDYVRNPVDGSVLIDHHGVPISVERLLSTKPLKQDLSTRPGPGNKKLTYMSGEVVTRTLNLIFGYDGWNLNIQNTQREECVQDEKGRWRVVYTALVRVTHLKSGSYREDCGMGDAIDKNMGIAISHAQKASITDAMKRAARHFGEKLGNSLYHGDFNVSRAPVSLQHALDQLDTERAKLLGTATNIKPSTSASAPTAVVSANPMNHQSASALPVLDQASQVSAASNARQLQCTPPPWSVNTHQAGFPSSLVSTTSQSRFHRPNGSMGYHNNQGEGGGRQPNAPYSHPNPPPSEPPPKLLSAPSQKVAHPHRTAASTSKLYEPAANSNAASMGANVTGIQSGAFGPNSSHSVLDTYVGGCLRPNNPARSQTVQQNNQGKAPQPASHVQNTSTFTNTAIDMSVSVDSMPPSPPTSSQGLQLSNLFGNKRDASELARPSTSVGRKSDPLPLPSEKSSLIAMGAATDDAVHLRAPLTSLPINAGETACKKAKINPYA